MPRALLKNHIDNPILIIVVVYDFQMKASGDDIEAVCHILSGNLMEGISSEKEEKSHKESSEG
jgi:hypothetical protein